MSMMKKNMVIYNNNYNMLKKTMITLSTTKMWLLDRSMLDQMNLYKKILSSRQFELRTIIGIDIIDIENNKWSGSIWSCHSGEQYPKW